MVHFAPPMISRTYDGDAKRFVSLGEMNLVDFAGFPPSRGPKRKECETNGGFARRMLRDPATRKWRRKPLESLKTDSQMAPRPAGKENRSGEPSVLDHRQVRGGRVLHAHDMVAGVDVDDLAGDPAGHRRQEIDRAVADLLDRDRAAQGRIVFVPPQDIAEVADAGGGERFDRAGRDRVDADPLLAEVGGEIADARLQRR